MELPLLAVHENVLPGTGKTGEGGIQTIVDIGTTQSPVFQLGAAHGPAVDHKMDAGIPVDGADDVVFDLIQGELLASCGEFHTAEEAVEQHDVFDAVDGIGVDHAAEDKSVVRVYPVGEFVAAGGEAVGMAARAGHGEAVDVRIQRISRCLQGGIINASQVIDMPTEDLVEQPVVKGCG